MMMGFSIKQVAVNLRKFCFESIGGPLLICFHNHSKVVAVYKFFAQVYPLAMNGAAELFVACAADTISRASLGHKNVLRLNYFFAEFAGKRFF